MSERTEWPLRPLPGESFHGMCVRMADEAAERMMKNIRGDMMENGNEKVASNDMLLKSLHHYRGSFVDLLMQHIERHGLTFNERHPINKVLETAMADEIREIENEERRHDNSEQIPGTIMPAILDDDRDGRTRIRDGASAQEPARAPHIDRPFKRGDVVRCEVEMIVTGGARWCPSVSDYVNVTWLDAGQNQIEASVRVTDLHLVKPVE